MMKQIRQGDVLLVPVDTIPADATMSADESGHVVLMHGEVTGHAHVIDRPETVSYRMTPDGRRFVELLKEVVGRNLKHEEHSEIMLDGRGKMQQSFQVEDFGQEVRRVTD